MATKKFSELTAATTPVSSSDLLVMGQSNGTKKIEFETFCKQILVPDIVAAAGDFPEIEDDDTLEVIAGKINKWQQDAIAKIETYILQSKIIQEFPSETFDPEDPDDPITEALHDEVISALLAYSMNQAILSVTADHGTLAADFAIQKREQMASYGYFGVEWNIDDLMTLVQQGKWDKFAIGDFFTEETPGGEKIEFEVTGKNSYLHCGDTELTAKHIVCSPRDCLKTYYKYNDTSTNAGGYAASKMPANLETEANKFTAKLQGYMTNVRRLENNKGAWAWATRRIFLPSNPELVGFHGWADQYDGGGFNQLPLFKGGNAHILKGSGYQKSKASRMAYWTADPSAANTTAFCRFNDGGYSDRDNASNELGVAPIIVLS